ncbi:MAG: GNAT family N-acetyltransferase [Pyrinomonadaceae bacterium]|nr:GNAT family N-acetyltransferase [Pyrinomonadaceae bacterium]
MSIIFQPADAADTDTLIEMMHELYAYDGTPFDEHSHRAALRQLLADERCGRVWLIQSGAEIAGYVVLTFGFSLEFKGRDAFIDELYLREPFRGQGRGQQALDFAADACRALGIRALHLEVERRNTRAQTAYRKANFKDHDRYLLTKWLND